MGIKVKGGDLTGTSKAEKKARAAKFSAKQNAVVGSRIDQSQNGFKGESKNEYGLPNGEQQVKTHVGPEYTGPKDRKQGAPMDKVGADKYAEGVKGIKLKPKTSMANDATSVKRPTDMTAVVDAQANKISKMDDKELLDNITSNSIRGDKAKASQGVDSLATRNIKKRGGYAEGTKGIKVRAKMP